MPCYAVARQGLVWKRRQQKKGSMDRNGAIGEAVLPRQATVLCPLRGGGEGVCVPCICRCFRSESSFTDRYPGGCVLIPQGGLQGLMLYIYILKLFHQCFFVISLSTSSLSSSLPPSTDTVYIHPRLKTGRLEMVDVEMPTCRGRLGAIGYRHGAVR